jgi:glyoxylase-like metal-dependent hydrolase (beta-lactamase superfamily II)
MSFDMIREADGVWRIKGLVADCLNVYLAGDVLIDAATRWHTWYLLRKLHGHKLSALALTHCHPDHQGAAWFFSRKFGIPLACHVADVPAMEGTGPMLPKTLIVHGLGRLIAGPPSKVKRVLKEGDTVGDFRVVHAPGHTPGHVIYFREADRVAICGDVLANISFVTLRPGLRLPPSAFCTDPMQNLRSAELLANLNPSLVCFGHGPPLHRIEQLHWFVERMRLRVAKRAAESGSRLSQP